MTTESSKSYSMTNFLNEFTKQFAPNLSRTDAIKNNICVFCGEPASVFKDELSKREFSISGLCQNCQNKVFG